MDKKLNNEKIAMITCEGFEASELFKTKELLEARGAQVQVISAEKNKVKLRSWKDGNWGDAVESDAYVQEAEADEFEALVIPGGTLNGDTLRTKKEALEFTKEFLAAGKVVAAICHGPQLLIELDAVRDRKATGYKAIKTDLENAGAKYEDSAIVTDNGIVTSRQPDDIPAFVDKIVEEIREGTHKREIRKSA